ncbi:MAG: VOC family protein [Ignavibacteria bacterium]|nr:VOC family protein [Ignavibacteria bacterium]
MQKIIPHLWFNTEAIKAAEFYTSVFGGNSKISERIIIKDTPSGETELVSFNLLDYSIMAISAGPHFKLNPSISFVLTFDAIKDRNAANKLDYFWEKLSKDGNILMPIDEYFFSKKFGWVEDKFGLSWQLILVEDETNERNFITPALMFVNEVYARAEEATDFYISIFNNSKRGVLKRYSSGMEPNKEGTILYTDFMLENQWFIAMDNGWQHDFNFNEAFSFIVTCETQDEIDYFWERLSSIPEAEQCGWVKDKYGISWQIIPIEFFEMIRNGTPKQIEQVFKVILKMRKLEINQLREAFLS